MDVFTRITPQGWCRMSQGFFGGEAPLHTQTNDETVGSDGRKSILLAISINLLIRV